MVEYTGPGRIRVRDDREAGVAGANHAPATAGNVVADDPVFAPSPPAVDGCCPDPVATVDTWPWA